jgi:O-antigen/teichoic acid export membrane protein
MRGEGDPELIRSRPGRWLSGKWQRFSRGSFVRGLAILTSASLLQNLITFASAPIVARLFAPEEFGIAGLIQTLGVLPVLCATGQYYLALGIARSRGESVNLAMLSVLLAPLLALALLPPVLVLQAYRESLPAFLVPVAPYFWTILIFMIAGGVLAVARLWEIRHAHYKPMVANRLIESGGIAAFQIGFGLLGAGPLGLIIGRWIGTAAAAVHGLRLVLGQIGRRGLRTVSLRRMRLLAIRHWRLPLYQLPANGLNEATRQLMPIMLAIFYSLESVGFFWFANRLLERPAIVFGSNVGRVFYQHAADRRQAGQRVSGLFWRSTGVLLAVSAVPFGAVIAFGPPLFAIVFGAEWELAGHYARWIAVANFAMLLAFPARGATVLFDLQGIFAIVETVRAITSGLAFFVVAVNGGGALLAIGAAATAQSILLLGFITFVGVRMNRLDRRPAASTAPPERDRS